MGTEREDALRALHAHGRESWPEVELDATTFATRAGHRLGDRPLGGVRADELYLAIACAVRIERAILAFEKHYLSGLAAGLLRRGQDWAAAAEIVQAVRVRFLVGDTGRGPMIAEYNGRGSLAAWLRVAASRIAMTVHRKRRRETDVDDVVIVAKSCGPDLGLLGLQLGNELEAAFRSAFAALAPRERNLLRYQIVDQLGVDRIAVLHGVHRATAARWSVHAREALIEGVRGELKHRLRLDGVELDIMFRQLVSQLELSLRWLLTPSRIAELGSD